jgi:hypothetical protein
MRLGTTAGDPIRRLPRGDIIFIAGVAKPGGERNRWAGDPRFAVLFAVRGAGVRSR